MFDWEKTFLSVFGMHLFSRVSCLTEKKHSCQCLTCTYFLELHVWLRKNILISVWHALIFWSYMFDREKTFLSMFEMHLISRVIHVWLWKTFLSVFDMHLFSRVTCLTEKKHSYQCLTRTYFLELHVWLGKNIPINVWHAIIFLSYLFDGEKTLLSVFDMHLFSGITSLTEKKHSY